MLRVISTILVFEGIVGLAGASVSRLDYFGAKFGVWGFRLGV